MADEVPYQRQPQVEQLQAERANAEAYGQTDRVAAVDKQLDALGVQRKTAAEKRKAAAEETGDDEKHTRSTPPQGRVTGPKTKT